MSDNVNIIVQDTINEIVVNTAVVVDTIDINVQTPIDEVTIITNPNNYIVNINRIIGEQVQSDWNQNNNQEPDYIKNKPTIPAAQVNSDWNASSGVAEILNKPTIPSIAGLATVVYVDQQDNLKVDKVAGKGLSENDFTNTLKTKLDGIQDGAEVNVNADWNATTGDAEILNKPTIPAAQVNSDWNATSGVEEILNKPSIPTLTSDLINDGEDGVNPFITAADLPTSVTSVGLTMPSAFTVTNSPITSSGDIAVTGAGTVSQYVRGNGTLANFPNSTGGGASVSYYLNGSVSQGTIGGVAYKEINGVPVIGTGTDFTINADGYIAQFITDVGDPNKLLIPAGNWNFETYFSASSGGGSPRFYIELYKYDGSTFTLIASNSTSPEFITGGTSIDLYLSALAVPPTTLLATDRLAVRFYVIHSGRTITMHTENSHLSQIITTFSTGLTALNGLTTQVQSFATGTSGTDFGISSATSTHTFNLPTASATNRGALSTTDWSAFNGKFNLPSLTSGSVLFSNGTTIAQDNANFFWDNTNKRGGFGTATPTKALTIRVNTNDDGILLQGATNSPLFQVTRDGASNNTAEMFMYSGGAIRLAIRSSANNSYFNGGNFVFGATTAGARLDVRAQGALSTDIAFRVRNSADTLDLLNVNGIGRVGIGIGSPAGKLDVFDSTDSSIYCRTGSVGANWLTGTVQSQFGTYTNHPLVFKTNDVARMRIDVAGNVGIGTTAPTARLDVRAPGALSTDIALRVRNSADSADLLVTNGLGNVGIGTSSPSYKLDVQGTGTTTPLRVVSSGNTSILLSRAGTTDNGDATLTVTNTGALSIVAANVIRMAPYNSENARFTNIGLLIGTTTSIASSKLTIESTTQGFLPPRMTNAQRLLIATPAIGLMVYCTDVVEGLYINKSTGWTYIG